jgi:hypothetical protein
LGFPEQQYREILDAESPGRIHPQGETKAKHNMPHPWPADLMPTKFRAENNSLTIKFNSPA